MFRKILLLIALLGMTAGLGAATAFESLPEAVQAARHTLLADTAACQALSFELVRLADVYPTSSYVPDALMLAARFEKSAGKSEAALQLATRVVKSYPTSESTPAAFDLAWVELTRNNTELMAGVPLAKELAEASGTNRNAGYYYEMAFNACRDSRHWKEALAIGEQYLKTCTGAVPNPRLLLSLADVALMAADTPQAMKWLEDYMDHYPNLPQIVAVRAKLGQMYAASGNAARAKENYSLAWTNYQKNAKNDTYRQADITEAAARSLWELQGDARREYENLTAIGTDLDKGRARRMMDNLIDAYSEVMTTDPRMAAQAFNAIGDAHTRYADALLKHGFQQAVNSKSPPSTPPYTAAAQEYGKAIASYSQAHGLAAAENGDVEQQRQAQYAASRAFELTAGQGDAVFAWAIHLYKNAPSSNLGEHGNVARIEYLNKQVLPRLEEGLICKSEALALAKGLPVEKEALEVRKTLDIAVRPPLEDLASLAHNEVHGIETASTQLSSSFKAGFQVSSTRTLAASLEENFAYATQLSQAVQGTLQRFYQTFATSALPQESLSFWNNMLAGAASDYAAACRTVQDDLAACIGKVTVNDDDSSPALYNRLTKLQAKGSTEEFAGLVKWHDFASEHNVQAIASNKLEARLAELDPTHYGSDGGTNSASRKKP